MADQYSIYVSVFSLAIAALLLVYAAYRDAKTYKIPNWSCVAVAALFPVYAYFTPVEMPWIENFLVSAMVLGIGFYFYIKKYSGAGDVKLLAALSLWSGYEMIGVLLFITAIAGGLLSVALAAVSYAKNKKESVAKIPVPYGVAIAIGGLCVFLTHSRKMMEYIEETYKSVPSGVL